MSGKLYVVATPIGNLSDITARAIETLRNVDLIAAEDTRVSSVLLRHFEISTKLVSNHKFNEASRVKFFIQEMTLGKNIAIISDAGTPCISDPGYTLVKTAAKEGIEIVGVCGACAAITAISISGFGSNSFSFLGFLPKESSGIKKALQKLINIETQVVVYYESPKRIIKTMTLFEEVLPDVNICLCNDLTKRYEKIYRGKPNEILPLLNENNSFDKGEYTIVVEVLDCIDKQNKKVEICAEAHIVNVMLQNNVTIKDAIKILTSSDTNTYSKNELFDAGLNLKELFY